MSTVAESESYDVSFLNALLESFLSLLREAESELSGTSVSTIFVGSFLTFSCSDVKAAAPALKEDLGEIEVLACEIDFVTNSSAYFLMFHTFSFALPLVLASRLSSSSI